MKRGYMIQNKKLKEIKADKMPIGISYNEKESFTNHKIALQKDDIFYLITDGYIDQFGGPENKRFTRSALRKLLIEIHYLPLNDQKKILNKTLENWMGNERQIDDITILGFRIP